VVHNAKDAARYDASLTTDLVTLRGKTHCLCGAPGWEAVADEVRRWIESKA
jgi:hypothetical protein